MDRLQSSLEAGPSGSSSSSSLTQSNPVNGKSTDQKTAARATESCCSGGSRNSSSNGSSSSSGGGGDLVPRPTFGPIEVSREKLQELTGLFDRQRLEEHSRLLDGKGENLREGVSILLSAAPNGALLVQGEGSLR